jgi:hypothetical protein
MIMKNWLLMAQKHLTVKRMDGKLLQVTFKSISLFCTLFFYFACILYNLICFQIRNARNERFRKQAIQSLRKHSKKTIPGNRFLYNNLV